MSRRGSLSPFAVWLVAAAGLLSLPACETPDGRDSSGRGVQVTDWETVDVSTVDTTLPLLLSQTVTKAEYQNRDNVINHNRMQLDGGKGAIYTQYAVTLWYNGDTERGLADIEKFKEEVFKAFKYDYAGMDEVRKIRHGTKKAVGFETIVHVRGRPVTGQCFYMHGGYRLRERAANDSGNIDTLVLIRYCDTDTKLADFSRAVENIDLVNDRAAFAAALAAK